MWSEDVRSEGEGVWSEGVRSEDVRSEGVISDRVAVLSSPQRLP